MQGTTFPRLKCFTQKKMGPAPRFRPAVDSISRSVAMFRQLYPALVPRVVVPAATSPLMEHGPSSATLWWRSWHWRHGEHLHNPHSGETQIVQRWSARVPTGTVSTCHNCPRVQETRVELYQINPRPTAYNATGGGSATVPEDPGLLPTGS